MLKLLWLIDWLRPGSAVPSPTWRRRGQVCEWCQFSNFLQWLLIWYLRSESGSKPVQLGNCLKENTWSRRQKGKNSSRTETFGGWKCNFFLHFILSISLKPRMEISTRHKQLMLPQKVFQAVPSCTKTSWNLTNEWRIFSNSPAYWEPPGQCRGLWTCSPGRPTRDQWLPARPHGKCSATGVGEGEGVFEAWI